MGRNFAAPLLFALWCVVLSRLCVALVIEYSNIIMLQVPQDLNMPPNNFPMPMSHDSGYHETDSPKSLAPSQNNDHGYIEPGGSSPDLDPCSPGDTEDYGMDVPINQRNDIGLSDQELVMMSTKDLNRLLLSLVLTNNGEENYFGYEKTHHTNKKKSGKFRKFLSHIWKSFCAFIRRVISG